MIKLTIFLSVILIDQLAKWYVFQQGAGVVNYGGVFGLFPSTWWLYFLMLIWAGLLVDWLRKTPKGLLGLGVGLILAGGLSNLIDRFLAGGVRDFIYYPWLNLHGNIADIALFVGVVLTTLSYWNQSRQTDHET